MMVDAIELVIGDIFDVIRRSPLPKYEGIEPSQTEVAYIANTLLNSNIDQLERRYRRWICHRFLPCVLRYGTYPPPDEPPLDTKSYKTLATSMLQ